MEQSARARSPHRWGEVFLRISNLLEDEAALPRTARSLFTELGTRPSASLPRPLPARAVLPGRHTGSPGRGLTVGMRKGPGRKALLR